MTPSHRADNCEGPRCNGGQGSGAGLSTCLCIHAEENALLEAGRERIREGSTLYCDTYATLDWYSFSPTADMRTPDVLV
jgi:dCMP deaminase